MQLLGYTPKETDVLMYICRSRPDEKITLPKIQQACILLQPEVSNIIKHLHNEFLIVKQYHHSPRGRPYITVSLKKMAKHNISLRIGQLYEALDREKEDIIRNLDRL